MFEIQTKIKNEWANTWLDHEKNQMQFSSRVEAQKALRVYLADKLECALFFGMSESPQEIRIMPVQEALAA